LFVYMIGYCVELIDFIDLPSFFRHKCDTDSIPYNKLKDSEVTII
jgi:hypothetical protein